MGTEIHSVNAIEHKKVWSAKGVVAFNQEYGKVLSDSLERKKKTVS